MAMLRRRFIPPEYWLGPLLRPVGQVDDREDLVDAGAQAGPPSPYSRPKNVRFSRALRSG